MLSRSATGAMRFVWPALRRGPAGWAAFLTCALAGSLAVGVLPAAARPPARVLHEAIDELVAAGQSGPVAPSADDAEFLRRVTLDLAGTIPTSAEARAFLDDPSPQKRPQWIDRLLADPRWVRRMTDVLDLMLMERRPDKHVSSEAWRQFLADSLAADKPYDELIREILSADGTEPAARPAAKFLLDRDGDPNLLTRDVGRLLLGMDLGCCQCHDHPLVDAYEQRFYYGIFAFLNRTVLFTDKQTAQVALGERADGDVSYKSVFVPETTRSTGPGLPHAEPLGEPRIPSALAYVVAPADGVRPVARYSRRARLAAALTETSRRQFSRNFVNRIWALLMGRGLVEPVDMHLAGREPSHPELLELLADGFIEAGYDIRWLVRELVLSQTYQRSSRLPGGADPAQLEPAGYALANLRPLSPEQLTWALLTATGVAQRTRAGVAAALEADPKLAAVLAADQRRGALRESLVELGTYQALAGAQGGFVLLFGSQPGVADQSFEATIHQALFLSNAGVLDGWLAPGPEALVSRLEPLVEPAVLAEELYLSVLSRRPEAEEVAALADYCQARADEPRVEVVKQLAWALMCSAEFRLNH